MSAAFAAVLLPFPAALALGFFGTPMQGAYANAAICALLFILTLGVLASPGAGMLHADSLGAIFGILTGFVGLTTAIANIGFVRGALLGWSVRRWRVYHATSQIMLGGILLGLYADNISLLWLAVEMATIAACLGVSLPRTASALAASWKYFVQSAIAIALALFGTMLIYLAASHAFGQGLAAMSFAALGQNPALLDGRLMALAFVFLLLGYGTQAALAPLHFWLPDADAQGPAPLSTVLAGLLPNVALIALLRFRHLMGDAAGGVLRPGVLLLALGLASLWLAAFSLWRRRDARRFFGISSIGHTGLAAFAFGIGGAPAIFAGLLHMLLHTLVNSALFQALIRAAALRGGTAAGNYGFSRLRGLATTSKSLTWLLGLSIFALIGLPPSGLFTSEFLIVSQTIQRAPLLSLPLAIGLGVAAIAVIRQLGPLLFGPPPNGSPKKAGADIGFIGLHLLAVLVLAFAMPWPLVRVLSGIAEALQ